MRGDIIDLRISLHPRRLWMQYRRIILAMGILIVFHAFASLGHLDNAERTVIAKPGYWNTRIPTIQVEVVSENDNPLLMGPDGRYYEYWKRVRAKITAYTPDEESCGQYADGRTSTGQNAWQMDGVAADPVLVPYGSLVGIPGVGYKEVDDTGAAMKKSWRHHGITHFDLRMTYRYQARHWGVKWMDVDLYKRVATNPNLAS